MADDKLFRSLRILPDKMRKLLTVMLVKRSIHFIHDIKAVRMVLLDGKDKCKCSQCLFPTAQTLDIKIALSHQSHTDSNTTIERLVRILQLQKRAAFPAQRAEFLLEVSIKLVERFGE